MEQKEKSRSTSPISSSITPKVTSFSIADILKNREERREQKERIRREQQEEALDMRRKSMKYRGKFIGMAQYKKLFFKR